MKWEDEEEENITPLAQAIFNCTTILLMFNDFIPIKGIPC